MTTPLKLRCSALPLAFVCPGSVRPEGMLIDETNDAATLGTAAHEGAAHLVRAGRVDWHGVGELAQRHGVDERELRILLYQASTLWAEVHQSFPNASTEAELAYAAPDGSFVLTGHADIIGSSADLVHVGDWKFGRLDRDHAEQLRGYAALAILKTKAREATAGVLWVREHEYEHYGLQAAEVPAWLERIKTEIVNWDGTFRSGSHCAHCPRNHECPAHHALVRRDVAVIADKSTVAQVEDGDALAAMAPAEIIAVLVRADMVSKYAERVRSAIRSHVMRGGDIVAGGLRLTLQHEERRALETLPAFGVLQENGFEDTDMAEVIAISVAKAEEIVAARAGKGKGAGAVRELRARLDEAGALKTSVVTKLIVKRG